MGIRENLVVLIDAVDAEPEKKFDLSTFEANGGCGTLHCTLGLAATLPYFHELGLKMTLTMRSAVVPALDGIGLWQPGAYSKLNAMFGEGSYSRLFEPAGEGYWDQELQVKNALTDKQLALARLHKQLEQYP